MKICDYHLHSEFSDDSHTPLEEIVKQAISLGLPEICITDHHDIDYPEDEEGNTFFLDTDNYINAVREIQHKYANQISIRLGVELGLMSHIADKIYAYTDKYNQFDFIIGSSHLVHGTDPYYPAYYEGRSENDALREYFESILENVSTFDNYSVYGHLDYIVRYCPSGETGFHVSDYMDIFEAIFRKIIDAGKGIEINTGSLYKNMTYAHPHPDILKLYREMGGEIITVGSDAHKPEYMAYAFETYARDLLTALGYRYYCTFKNMKPVFHPL